VFRRGLRELREDLELQIQNLRDGLDHKVYISEVVEFGRGLETAAHGVGVALADFRFADVLGEQLVGEGQAFVERGLGRVDEDDGDAGLAGGNEGDSETLWEEECMC
jgi:hypothetical protein